MDQSNLEQSNSEQANQESHLEQRVIELFHQSIEATMSCGEAVATPLTLAAQQMNNSLLNDGKLLLCGSSTSASIAEIASTHLAHRFEQERPGLPAICLHHDSGTQVALSTEPASGGLFAKPLRTLAHPGDALLIISGGGSPPSLVETIRTAHDINVNLIVMTALGDENLRALLTADDLEIHLPIERKSRLLEVQLLAINSLCDLLDFQLFGGDF
ncbi:MAG: SIS domain-containing protein [Cellvibrionaceae bacterium]